MLYFSKFMQNLYSRHCLSSLIAQGTIQGLIFLEVVDASFLSLPGEVSRESRLHLISKVHSGNAQTVQLGSTWTF